MLPTTPLHHLLLAGGPALLVMTSGNRAGEPIAKDDDRARAVLGGLADAFLVHDRPIHTRVDDSVVRIVAGVAQPVRRARGFVPDPVRLGHDAPCVLAVGAQLKATVCLTRGADAFVSQHLGDLGGLEAQAFFEEVIRKLQRLLGVTPAVVAHDMHPDYASTGWALASGLPTVAVQHHHAHVAACLAENGRTEPTIGVAFDGTGCGPAGDLWGGELLLADLGAFRRIGHLRAIPLPGGEAAIREPWRMGIAALHDAGEALPLSAGGNPRLHDVVRRMIDRGVGCPSATGAGRWFDAVAAITGVRGAVTYEGQAAIEMEALAASEPDARPYAFALGPGDPFVIDLRPTIRAIAADVRLGLPAAVVAARFHATVAHCVLQGCRRAREENGVSTVALSGGCFQNRILARAAAALLDHDGFEVLTHRLVPPNDGGVSLGQAAVAVFSQLHQKGGVRHVSGHSR